MHIQLKNADKIAIKQSADIFHIMQLILKREQLIDRTKEHFWTIALNVAHKIVNIELVGMGTVKKVLVDPVEVFSVPVQKKASNVVLIHNHPSGRLKPSDADIEQTNRLIQAGLIMDTPVLDHVIITEHSYFSFEESGLLEKLRWDNKYALTFVREKQLKQEVEKRIQKMQLESKEREQKGKAKGLQEGRKERNMEIAKHMLIDGKTHEEIQKYTNLSKAWVTRLSNELRRKRD